MGSHQRLWRIQTQLPKCRSKAIISSLHSRFGDPCSFNNTAAALLLETVGLLGMMDRKSSTNNVYLGTPPLEEVDAELVEVVLLMGDVVAVYICCEGTA